MSPRFVFSAEVACNSAWGGGAGEEVTFQVSPLSGRSKFKATRSGEEVLRSPEASHRERPQEKELSVPEWERVPKGQGNR